MGFKPLEEVLGDQSLHLPIRGKTYTIHPPNAEDGLSLGLRLAAGIATQAGANLDANEAMLATVDDGQLPDLARQCLNGPHAGEPQLVYEQMLKDGLTFQEIEMAVSTAFLAWTVDHNAAEIFWNSAGKAGSPTLPPSGRPPTATPTQGAAATTTPRPASATGTRRKARAKAAKAARSAGSSPTTTT